MERKPIKPGLRFKIFSRDSFTCQYCGRSAPEVTLEIDHFKPVSKFGKNDIENLITSCHQCNIGKFDKIISYKPLVTNEKGLSMARVLSEIETKKQDILHSIELKYKEKYQTDKYLNQFRYLFNILWFIHVKSNKPDFVFVMSMNNFLEERDELNPMLDDMELLIEQKENKIKKEMYG